MKSAHVFLLIEDNPADAQIMHRAIKESGLGVRLVVVRDGQEALEYLSRSGQFCGEGEDVRPDLIILDINLPGMNGLEVLERIRATARWRLIPVIVLTTSCQHTDIRKMYAAGANTYIAKPLEFQQFVQVFRSIYHYWIELALLPSYSD